MQVELAGRDGILGLVEDAALPASVVLDIEIVGVGSGVRRPALTYGIYTAIVR